MRRSAWCSRSLKEGKEGKSKAITSGKYLAERFQEVSKEGVVLAASVETLEVDLRTRTKKLEAKEKERRKKCDMRFFVCQDKSGLPEKLHEDLCEEAVEDGCGPCECSRRVKLLAPRLQERLKLRRQMAAAGKKESVSLSPFFEVNLSEVEEELPTMAPQLLQRKVSGWEDGERAAEEGLEKADL